MLWVMSRFGWYPGILFWHNTGDTQKCICCKYGIDFDIDHKPIF